MKGNLKYGEIYTVCICYADRKAIYLGRHSSRKTKYLHVIATRPYRGTGVLIYRFRLGDGGAEVKEDRIILPYFVREKRPNKFEEEYILGLMKQKEM